MLLAVPDLDSVVYLIVFLLIAIGTAIKAAYQHIAQKKAAEERGGKPPPPVSTQIRREVLKYLGEIPPEDKAAGTGGATAAPPAAPVPRRLTRPPPAPPPTPALPPILTISDLRPRKESRARARAKARKVVGSRRTAPLTRRDLRRAILHREILGPPVALRRPGRTVSRLLRR